MIKRYKDMTKDQVVRLSIEHWQDNLCCVEEGHYKCISYSGSSCPLCQKYFDKESADPCSNCPLKMIEDCCLVEGSSWDVVAEIIDVIYDELYPIEKDVIRKAVIKLIDSLESLED